MIKLILKAAIGIIFFLCLLVSTYFLIRKNKKRLLVLTPLLSFVLFITAGFDFLDEIGVYAGLSDTISEYGIILFFVLWIFGAEIIRRGGFK